MSRDINVTVESLLEKLKSQGAFDSKRKVFLSEITNKSSFQNLHTKVENLTTKFLDNIRWPPTTEKHNLREQLRLHIQSTDQFNDYIDRLVDQEINCKIQSDLIPLIEKKACEYLEVDYDQWKLNIHAQVYEDGERTEHGDNQMDIDETADISPNIIDHNDTSQDYHQSATVSSSEASPPHQNIAVLANHVLRQTPMVTPPFMMSNAIPDISLLPPPHSIHPLAPFPCLPPPPLLIQFDQFPLLPPPPPPELAKPPSPPPFEAGPLTPLEEYVPESPAIQIASKERYESTTETVPDTCKRGPKTKSITWYDVAMELTEISDNSISDSEGEAHSDPHEVESPPGSNKLEPQSDPIKIQAESDSKSSKDLSDSNKLGTRPESNKYKGRPDSNQVEGRSAPNKYEARSTPNKYEARSGPYKYEGRPDSNKNEGRPDSNRYERRSGSNKYDGRQGSNKYEDRSGPNKYEDRSGANKYEDRSGPNKYEDRLGANKYEDRSGPNKYDDRPGSNKYEDRSDSNQVEGRSAQNKYEDRSGPNKYEDRSGPNKYDNRSGPNKYEDRSGPNKYEDRSGPNKYEGRPGTNTFEARSQYKMTDDHQKNHNSYKDTNSEERPANPNRKSATDQPNPLRNPQRSEWSSARRADNYSASNRGSKYDNDRGARPPNRSRWPQHAENHSESKDECRFPQSSSRSYRDSQPRVRTDNRRTNYQSHEAYNPGRGPYNRGDRGAASRPRRTSNSHSRSGSRQSSEVSWKTVEGDPETAPKIEPTLSKPMDVGEGAGASVQVRKDEIRARLHEIEVRKNEIEKKRMGTGRCGSVGSRSGSCSSSSGSSSGSESSGSSGGSSSGGSSRSTEGSEKRIEH